MAAINVLDMACDRDASQLRTLLPDRVWLLVADAMTSQTDLVNFSNSSPYFRWLIKSRRVNFLFSKVWDVMGEKYIKAECRFSDSIDHLGGGCTRSDLLAKLCNIMREENINAESLFSDSTDHLGEGFSAVLKLRLVSKDFKQAVDDYYLEKVLRWHDNEQGGNFEQVFKQERSNQRWHTKLPTFLTHFNDTHAKNRFVTSPFLSRSVTFSFCPESTETAQEFTTNIFSLLSIYGHHLQKCSFNMFGQQMQYGQLRELLQFLPNLKILRISKWLNYNMSQLLGNPLPRFENLGHLAVVNSVFPICAHLLQVNNQITSLEITHDENSGPANIFCEQLPNLKKLMLNIQVAFEFSRLKAARFSPNFNTLEIRLNTDNATFSVPELFTVAGEKWANSLTSFSLKTQLHVYEPKNKTSYEETLKNFQQRCTELKKANLPHVTNLTIDIPVMFCLHVKVSRNDV